MPISAMNFATLPTEGDPLMAALIPAYKRGIELKYMQPNMQADLQKKQLANALMQVESMYADPMAQAKLDYANAQIPNLKAQTTGQDLQNALSQIELNYAPQMKQADLDIKRTNIPFTKMKTDLMPYQTLAQLLNSSGRYNQSVWQSSPNSQLIRLANNPQMQSLISNNPEVAAAVTKTLGNIGLGYGGGKSNGNAFNLSDDMINKLTGGLNGEMGGGDIEDITTDGTGNMIGTDQSLLPVTARQLAQQLTSMQQPQQQQFSPMQQGMQQPQQLPVQSVGGGFTPSNEDINNIMQASGDAFLKKTRTAQQLNQGTYASELDGLFNAGDELMPSVVKYTGILGKAKGVTDKALSQFEQTDPDYKNYWNFTHVVAPNTANEMRRTLGGQATDYEGKLMSNLANPVYWDSNPELAMGQWNYLTKLYKDKINPSVYGNNFSINKRMRGEQSGLTISPDEAKKLVNSGVGKPGKTGGIFAGNNKPSQSDLEHTAQKYGITVDQVKQKLGVS